MCNIMTTKGGIAMNRIKELRMERHLNMRETAKLLNLPYTTYVNYEKGAREPNSEMLITIANFFEVSIDYLLKRSNERSPNLLDTDDKILEELEPYNPIMHKIPILGDIAAGLPMFAEENIEGYTYTDLNHGGKYFALRVKGDSMTAANIPDGSLVTVRVQPQVENGEIAAVRVNNDSFTVKRFKQDKNIVMLIPQSYNPEHQVQIYDLRKDKIDIVGKVMKCEVDF